MKKQKPVKIALCPKMVSVPDTLWTALRFLIDGLCIMQTFKREKPDIHTQVVKLSRFMEEVEQLPAPDISLSMLLSSKIPELMKEWGKAPWDYSIFSPLSLDDMPVITVYLHFGKKECEKTKVVNYYMLTGEVKVTDPPEPVSLKEMIAHEENSKGAC